MSIRLRWPALLLAMVSLSAAQAAPLYKVNILAGGGAAYDLNDAGQVVGRANGNSYLWSAQGATQLQKDFSPRAINNHGVIAGTMYIPSEVDGSFHAYTYFNQVYQRATGNTPGVFNRGSYAFDINDSGVVVGDNFDGYAYVPARFQQLQIKEFPLGYGYASAINASGTIVGTFEFDEPGWLRRHSFIYVNGTVQDIPVEGFDSVYAQGLNDANKVVGHIESSSGNSAYAYIYANGHLDKLDVLGASYSQATRINNRDQVVGSYGQDYADQKPFLYDGGTSYDLNTLLVPGSGLTVTRVAAINNVGQIAGQGCDSRGKCYAVLLSAVPEPQTWGMWLAGAGLIAWLTRRRNSAGLIG